MEWNDHAFVVVMLSGVARVQRLPGHLVGVSLPHCREVWGHAPPLPPENFWCSKVHSRVFWGILFSTCMTAITKKLTIWALVGTLTVERLGKSMWYHKVNFDLGWFLRQRSSHLGLIFAAEVDRQRSYNLEMQLYSTWHNFIYSNVVVVQVSWPRMI